MGFPRQVNVQGAPAVLGDFCDANPRATVDAGPGGFVAGPNGLSVGRFGWADSSNITVSNTGTGAPTGFVRRDQRAIITGYLADDSLSLYPGAPVTLFNEGGFWVLNAGSTASAIGMTAYADYTSGAVTFGTSAPTSGSATAATLAQIISAATGATVPATAPSMTASISGTVLTVTAVAAGTVVGVGQVLSGGSSTLGYVDPNTTILSYGTGTGGVGTYNLNISGSVLSGTITASGGCMTLVGANASGIFAVGQTLTVATSGTFTAGTTITAIVTGTGGAGTYLLNQPAATAVAGGVVTASNAMFLTVAGTVTGSFYLNDLLTGSGVAAGTSITATGAQNTSLTGLGGAGTYLTSTFQTALTAQTIGVNTGVATKWVASSVGAAGELVKMTSWLNG